MKNRAIKTIVFCLMILSSLNSIAQPGVEDALATGNLESTDATPINDYIIPMIMIGVILSFSLLRKKSQFVK